MSPNDEMGINPYVNLKMAGFCITLTTKSCNELSWPLDGMMLSHKKAQKSFPKQLKNI